MSFKKELLLMEAPDITQMTGEEIITGYPATIAAMMDCNIRYFTPVGAAPAIKDTLTPDAEGDAPQVARTAEELPDTMKEQEIGCADRTAEELAAEMPRLTSGIGQWPDLRQEEGTEETPPRTLSVTLTKKERRVAENLPGRELEAPEWQPETRQE